MVMNRISPQHFLQPSQWRQLDARVAPFGYRFVPAQEAIAVFEEETVEQVMSRIDQVEYGTLVVLGPQQRLVGVLADADLRKYILNRGAMDAPVAEAMNKTPHVLAENFSHQDLIDHSKQCHVACCPALVAMLA